MTTFEMAVHGAAMANLHADLQRLTQRVADLEARPGPVVSRTYVLVESCDDAVEIAVDGLTAEQVLALQIVAARVSEASRASTCKPTFQVFTDPAEMEPYTLGEFMARGLLPLDPEENS